MRRTRSLSILLLVVSALMLALVLAGAAGAGGPVNRTFVDPTGDAKDVADITTVRLSHDPTSGAITVTVLAPGFGTPRPGASGYVSWLDIFIVKLSGAGASLSNNANHLELRVRGRDSVPPDVPQIYWWDGGQQTAVTVPPSVGTSYSRSGDQVTWVVAKADLRDLAPLIGLQVGSHSSVPGAGQDNAPDTVTHWVVDLSGAPSFPKVAKVTANPARPVAGSRFVVRFAVMDGTTGDPITTASITSVLRIGGETVKHTQRFAESVALTSVVVPKSAKGKPLKLIVTVRFAGKIVTSSVSFTVT